MLHKRRRNDGVGRGGDGVIALNAVSFLNGGRQCCLLGAAAIAGMIRDGASGYKNAMPVCGHGVSVLRQCAWTGLI